MADELRCMSRPCDGRCLSFDDFFFTWMAQSVFQTLLTILSIHALSRLRLGVVVMANALCSSVFGGAGSVTWTGFLGLRWVRGVGSQGSYLVDPASSHMLVSKIKPCMSKYKLLIL